MSTEIMSILNSSMAQLQQIGSGGQGSGTGSSGSDFQIGNFLNGSMDYTSTGSGTNGNQTANIIQSALKSALNLLSSVGAQEAQRAKQETTKTNNAIAKTQDAQQAVKSATDQQIEAINQQIEQIQAKIQAALEAKGELDEKLQEEQNKANDINKDIQEQQEALKNAKTEEEKEQILGQLTTSLEGLEEVFQNIDTYNNTAADLKKENTENENAVVEAGGAKQNVVADGQAKITTLASNVVNHTTTATVHTGEAVKDKAISAAANAAANTASAIPIGGAAAAAEYRMVATDHDNGSQTFRSAVVDYVKSLTQIGSGLSSNLAGLSQFSSIIDGNIGTANGCIGSMDNALPGLIASIGSSLENRESSEEFATLVENEEESSGGAGEGEEESGEKDGGSVEEYDVTKFEFELYSA